MGFTSVTVHLTDERFTRPEQITKYGDIQPEVLKAMIDALQHIEGVTGFFVADEFMTITLFFAENSGDADAVEFEWEGKVLDALGVNANLVDTVVVPNYTARKRNGRKLE